MKARSGQNHDNKIAPQVSCNPPAANIMDMLCIFVITKRYSFQRVGNYFQQQELLLVLIIGIPFSFMPLIIFLICIKNYFLIGPRIIFRGIANLFFGLKCIAGLAFEVDWFESLTSFGDHFENFAGGGVLSKRMPRRNTVRERNERGFHLSYKFKQKPHAAFKLNILFETFPVHVALHFIN